MPTHEDANLILRLYELRREERMRQARAWFTANFYVQNLADMQALCPIGSEENASMRMVTSYWDMVASFVATGVLNEELFFQSGRELLLVWIRIKPMLDEARKAFGPVAWRNLEVVAERYIAYLESMAPGSYASFVARMGTRPAPPAAKGA